MSPTVDTAFETDITYPFSYFQTVVESGPLAYWRLGEASLAVDAVGGHDGSWETSPIAAGTVSVVDGLLLNDPDSGYELGDGASVLVPWGSWMDTAAFSFEGIFTLTGTPDTGVVVARATVEKFCWAFRFDATSFTLNTLSDQLVVPMALGGHHFVITGSGSAMKLYLDGTFMGTMAYSADDNTGGQLSFGALTPEYGEDPFPGVLDEFAYYDYALLSDVVRDHYLRWALSGPGGMIETIIETSSVGDIFRPVVVSTQGGGQVSIPDSGMAFLGAELRLRILDPEVVRAPSSITVTVSGGVAQEDVTFAIDGNDLYTTSLDSDGNLGPTSLNLDTTNGSLGTHALSVTQITTEGVTSGSANFVVLRSPALYPNVAGVDAPPVEVPDALVFEGGHYVRHWVFQDLLAESQGGIGSYVLPHNPRNMTSPHLEHALSSVHSTASDGKIHVFQAGNLPKEWQFTGFCPSRQQQEAMTQYRNLNRRFYVIDHRNRAWKGAMINAEFVPRLRQNYNGIPTDWGSDYTITMIVLDQVPIIPEEV